MAEVLEFGDGLSQISDDGELVCYGVHEICSAFIVIFTHVCYYIISVPVCVLNSSYIKKIV